MFSVILVLVICRILSRNVGIETHIPGPITVPNGLYEYELTSNPKRRTQAEEGREEISEDIETT